EVARGVAALTEAVAADTRHVAVDQVADAVRRHQRERAAGERADLRVVRSLLEARLVLDRLALRDGAHHTGGAVRAEDGEDDRGTGLETSGRIVVRVRGGAHEERRGESAGSCEPRPQFGL